MTLVLLLVHCKYVNVLLLRFLVRIAFSMRESFAKLLLNFELPKFSRTFFEIFLFQISFASFSRSIADRFRRRCFSKASAKVDTFRFLSKYFWHFFQDKFCRFEPNRYQSLAYAPKKLCCKTYFLDKTFIPNLFFIKTKHNSLHSILKSCA